MESWRVVWRGGFAPVLSTGGLNALLNGLENDDPRLVQGCTTTPPPLMCVQDWPVEACCALGYAGWQGDGLTTVGEVEEHFAKCCYEADQRLGEAAACRWFLNAFDDTPRHEIFAELAFEVRRELLKRELREVVKEEAVEPWLETPNDAFGGRTPSSLLKAGESGPLNAALTALRGELCV